MLKRNPFIIPSAPILKSQPPTGPQWLHEVRFDGWRAQLHKTGDEVAIFTRHGHDYTRRFPAIRDSLLSLPATSAIIDAEIVVCDSDGKPDFKALMDVAICARGASTCWNSTAVVCDGERSSNARQCFAICSTRRTTMCLASRSLSLTL